MNRLVLLGLALVLLVGLVVAGWHWQQHRVVQQAYEAGMAAADADRYEEALALALPYADRHDPDIDHLLGMIYLNGPDSIKDIEKGLTHRRAAAEAGNMQAAYYLGKRLIKYARDDSEAEEGLEWLTLAADCGMPAAHFELGVYFGEVATAADAIEQALDHFKIAAWAGIVEAQENLVIVSSRLSKITGNFRGRDAQEILVWMQILANKDFRDYRESIMRLKRSRTDVSENDLDAFWSTIERKAIRWNTLIVPADRQECGFTSIPSY